MPVVCSALLTPTMTSSPPTTCWECSVTSREWNDLRPAATRLSSPTWGSSGWPVLEGIRRAMSPPDGSHSTTRLGRGHSAPSSMLVVVTPGAPFAEATTSRPMAQSSQVVRTTELPLEPMRAGVTDLSSMAWDTGERQETSIETTIGTLSLVPPRQGPAFL